MFEPDTFTNASITHGLVFVDTDHGFALGHDPAARPDLDIFVARLRNDDRDRMLYDSLGHPPTYLYKFDHAAVEAKPSVVPWTPPDHAPTLRFEAEAEWPPVAQVGGFAVPEGAPGCASGSRVLVVTPTPGPNGERRAQATITVPVMSEGKWLVDFHVVTGPSVPYAPQAQGPIEGAIAVKEQRWTWKPGAVCVALPPKEVELSPPYAVITIEATNGPVAVDFVGLKKR
jgi:hypothetical protein